MQYFEISGEAICWISIKKLSNCKKLFSFHSFNFMNWKIMQPGHVYTRFHPCVTYIFDPSCLIQNTLYHLYRSEETRICWIYSHLFPSHIRLDSSISIQSIQILLSGIWHNISNIIGRWSVVAARNSTYCRIWTLQFHTSHNDHFKCLYCFKTFICNHC